MDDAKTLVLRSRGGDVEAYGLIVRRYQDMAVGYAFSILRDLDLAEDAAQEAFIDAYHQLAALREPAAFPGWLRRIVFKHCDRVTRRARLRAVPLESAGDLPSPAPDPSQAAQSNEIRDRVLEAIGALPDAEREATALFYINGYTQNEVSEFLNVPVMTVKNRLRSARNRLRERMSDMAEKTLKQSKPGAAFAKHVMRRIAQMRVFVGKEHSGSSSGLMLTDMEKRSVQLSLGRGEAAAISPWMEGKGSLDALDLHTALYRTLKRFGWRIAEVALDELYDHGLFARVHLRKGRQTAEAKTRLSDALAMAVRAGAPVYVDPEVASRREMKRYEGRPAEAWESVLKGRRRRLSYPPMETVLKRLDKDPASKEARRHFHWSLMTRVSRLSFKKDPDKLAQLEKWAEGHRGGEIEGVACGLLGAGYLHFDLDDPSAAIAPLETAHRLRPADGAIAFDLATAYALSGKKSQALALLTALHQSGGNPNDAASEGWTERLFRSSVVETGNFADLWSNPRFERLFGKPRLTRADTYFIAQTRHLIVGMMRNKPRRFVFPDSVDLIRRNQAWRNEMEQWLGCGKLLQAKRLSRPEAKKKEPWLHLEMGRGGDAAMRLTREDRVLFDKGTLTTLYPRPTASQAVMALLEAAGVQVEAAALLKGGHTRVEGAVILRSGERREAIALDGFAAIRLACAARRPLLVAESLAARLIRSGGNFWN
ncbi:MAG: DUF151 domain-containing protein [Candidatus Sumerlaeota bacterium]|nr:DUF151 domain-containing protein [Candidatus Sumerlaeota bacterium]